MNRISLTLLLAFLGLVGNAQMPSLSKEESVTIQLDSTKDFDWMVDLDSRVLAITLEGNVDILEGDELESTPCNSIVPEVEEVKEMVTIGSELFTIMNNGLVKSYSFQNDKISKSKIWTGAKIGFGGVPAKYIVAIGSGIGVINTRGELWYHVVGKKINNAVQIPGRAIAADGVPAVDVFVWQNQLVVLNSQGELWAHTIVQGQNHISIGFPRKVVAPQFLNVSKICAVGPNLATLSNTGELTVYFVKE